MTSLSLSRALLLAAAAAAGFAQSKPAPGPRGLPDAPGKDAVQRVCGSSCHGPQIVAGKGYSRENWATVVNGMIARGAKVEASEFDTLVDYLGKNLPPRTGSAGAGGSGFIGAGPDDAHVVDPELADKGRSIYVAECVTCHGNKARGGPDSLPPAQRGSDLVRSLVVLKDRYGATIGEFLRKGHPTQSGKPSSEIKGEDAIHLAHFLHQKMTDTLRSGPYNRPINVLTGDAKAGRAYFEGAGGCTACHSTEGDLKGAGSWYEPVTLQQKFLFPKSFAPRRGGGRVSPPKPSTVDVTVAGKTVSGLLLHVDDFNVSLRDASGEYRSFARTAGVKVTVHDPYAGHVALLDKYTDKNIHDVVAYLETLR